MSVLHCRRRLGQLVCDLLVMPGFPAALTEPLLAEQSAVWPQQAFRWVGREGQCIRAELQNKALGLAGQAEVLIGHLYNLIQSWSNFWVAIAENCTESGQWPAAI